MSLLTAMPSRGSYGYTCKTWIAYQLEKHYFGGNFYVWFSRELNPVGNGDSSNPLELYLSIDKAVKKRDINHPKLKDFKTGLLPLIKKAVPDRVRAQQLKHDLMRGPPELFRPQIWRIDLSKIAASRIRTDRSTADWDEQYIPDLTETEFEIIVE